MHTCLNNASWSSLTISPICFTVKIASFVLDLTEFYRRIKLIFNARNFKCFLKNLYEFVWQLSPFQASSLETCYINSAESLDRARDSEFSLGQSHTSLCTSHSKRKQFHLILHTTLFNIKQVLPVILLHCTPFSFVYNVTIIY